MHLKRKVMTNFYIPLKKVMSEQRHKTHMYCTGYQYSARKKMNKGRHPTTDNCQRWKFWFRLGWFLCRMAIGMVQWTKLCSIFSDPQRKRAVFLQRCLYFCKTWLSIINLHKIKISFKLRNSSKNTLNSRYLSKIQ